MPSPGAGTAAAPGVLAIDVGNAYTGLALWHGALDGHHWQLSTDRRRTPDEYRWLLAELLAADGLAPAEVQGCVLGAVVPDVVPPLVTACTALFGVPVLVVGPGVKTGLRLRTEDPREIGPDRVANAVAAVARFGAPVLVLDFSTALTIDVVDARGDYAGAIIAPGLEVAAAALASRTAKLPRGSLAPPPSVIASNTEHGLQAGLFYGYLGLVEGLVARVHAELGPTPVIATGEATWLPDLLEHCAVIDAYEPLLTLDGLRRIFEHQAA